MIIPVDIYAVSQYGDKLRNDIRSLYINSKKILYLCDFDCSVQLDSDSTIYITEKCYNKFKELLFKSEGIVDEKRD